MSGRYENCTRMFAFSTHASVEKKYILAWIGQDGSSASIFCTLEKVRLHGTQSHRIFNRIAFRVMVVIKRFYRKTSTKKRKLGNCVKWICEVTGKFFLKIRFRCVFDRFHVCTASRNRVFNYAFCAP